MRGETNIMGRGLGRIQRRIIEVINRGEAEKRYEDKVGHHWVTFSGWTDIEYLMDYVVNGHDCWRKQDSNDIEYYDPSFVYRKPKEADKQSIWRSIRTLEKRGLIESRTFPLTWEERWDRPNHRKYPNRWGNCDLKKGGANKQKAIRLVHSTSRVDSTLNEVVPPFE